MQAFEHTKNLIEVFRRNTNALILNLDLAETAGFP
jgi:hypothetical protein